MGLEGSIRDFGLADILQLIYFQHKTGTLTVTGKADTIKLELREGNIVSAESKKRTESNRLGKLLVKKGVVEETVLKTILEKQKGTNIKLGSLLVKSNIAGAGQVEEIVKSQIIETVVQLFLWKEGTYKFQSADIPVDKDLPISLDSQHILMDGLRIIDEWSVIQGRVTPDSVFQKTGKPLDLLNEEEQKILKFIDGENDVNMIVNVTESDSNTTAKVLLSLLEKGIIRPRKLPEVILEAPAVSVKGGTPVIRFLPAAVFLTAFLISIISSLTAFKTVEFSRFRAFKDLYNIRMDIEIYKYKNSIYPESVGEVAGTSDRWGNPYIYKKEGEGFILYSTGPDGKEGTADDLY